ncbi:MAG: SDR family oxidoreductase [Thermoleophilia bacterium]|nr:SDR family oxidoreductase [Thermoleophilia bacterium]
MLLEDRVAIVTGGAKGLGRGIAERFAKEGAGVTLADIAVPEAEETQRAIEATGGRALAVKCDVTSADQVREMVAATIAAFGKVDILVNNAGSLLGVPGATNLATVTEEAWDRVVDLNLKGAFLCSREVVPHMQAKGYGKIINMSSMGAIHPPMPTPHYNSAKAGLLGLTYDMATEFARHNIHVNAILPGPIRTTFYDKATGSMTPEETEAFFAMLGGMVPLQRVGTPEDIAGAALFLASDLSSYVTGVALPVAGGLT